MIVIQVWELPEGGDVTLVVEAIFPFGRNTTLPVSRVLVLIYIIHSVARGRSSHVGAAT